MWEDEENKRGGKWIMRLKKGIADRYWEDLLLALIGDQFAEAGEEVCGAVVSVRSGEDVFSIWTKNDGGRNVNATPWTKRDRRRTRALRAETPWLQSRHPRRRARHSVLTPFILGPCLAAGHWTPWSRSRICL